MAAVYVSGSTDEDQLRHMALNSVRMYNKKYREEYGQTVICTDGRNSWRREYYPQYKAARRDAKSTDSSMDWAEIFRIMGNVIEDLRTNFPYKVINIDGCEGDDIIGALTHRTQDFGQHEPVMIISSDGDFKQLQRFSNVTQFSPMQKKFVRCKNPEEYRLEHIFKGDKGDGVPNIKSGDDTFVLGERQPPIYKKDLNLWADASKSNNLKGVMTEDQYRNFQRNRTLVDLEHIPESIYNKVIDTYDEQRVAHQSKVLNYLIKNRMRLLIECCEEFHNG